MEAAAASSGKPPASDKEAPGGYLGGVPGLVVTSTAYIEGVLLFSDHDTLSVQ